MGDEAYIFEIDAGHPTDFRRDDSLLGADLQLGKADIAINAPATTWDKCLSAPPPAGFQNPLFYVGSSGWNVEGDHITAVGPFFWPVQQFLDMLRQVRNGTPPAPMMPRIERDFDDAIGRYMYVDIQGTQYRIYYEEAGHGDIPMVLQHTAGGEGAQWRHVLQDPDYQKIFRMISYDLPFHGKSLPPTTKPWWEERYVLTRSFLMDAVVAISRKLGLDRPVFMGCSVGGMLAPDLAFYHPDDFRAVIAVNGALGFDPSLRSLVEHAHARGSDPRVDNSWFMSLMHSNMGPSSPLPYCRETEWIYSQGGPGVNEGDAHYYAIGHDLTADQAAQIDTSRVGVYIITGEYDGLAIDDSSKHLADAIKGSYFELVPGLGHFGPAENPEGAKEALLRVFRDIAAKSYAMAE
jgi:pimeloyl-ACP methyl ester carboxylesterase